MAFEEKPAPITVVRRFGEFTFDATFSEQHESSLDVTEFQVEDGSTISDNAVIKPKRLTIEAGVSDAVLKRQQDDPFDQGGSRAEAAYRLLVELQETREPFDIVTGLRTYRSMMLVSLRATQDANSDSVLDFTAECKEVRITKTEVVKYPPRKPGPTHRQASGKRKLGEQQGKHPSESESARAKTRSKSVLASGSDMASGALRSIKSLVFK